MCWSDSAGGGISCQFLCWWWRTHLLQTMEFLNWISHRCSRRTVVEFIKHSWLVGWLSCWLFTVSKVALEECIMAHRNISNSRERLTGILSLEMFSISYFCHVYICQLYNQLITKTILQHSEKGVCELQCLLVVRSRVACEITSGIFRLRFLFYKYRHISYHFVCV